MAAVKDPVNNGDSGLISRNKINNGMAGDDDLGDLNDVDLTSNAPVINDVLQFNGSVWLPVDLDIFGQIRLSKLNNPLTHILKKNKIVDTLDGPLTWDRNSTATYIDRYGILRTAAVDEAREEKIGFLFEGENENIALHSEDFTDVFWAKSRATITSNDTTAPDETTTADKMEDNAIGQTSIFISSANLTLVSSTEYTFSIFVKAITENKLITIRLSSGQFTVNAGATFNTTTGLYTANAVGATVETLNDGWFRLSITNTTASTPTGNLTLFEFADDIVSESVHIWGGQLENSPEASSYIPTSTVALSRLADNVSILFENNAGTDGDRNFTIFCSADTKSSIAFNRVFSYSTDIGENQINVDATAFRGSKGGQAAQVFVGGNDFQSIAHYAYVATETDFTVTRIDGLTGEVSSNTQSFTGKATLDSRLTLGSRSTGSNHLYGHISDFRIYDFVLNAAEITFLAGE